MLTSPEKIRGPSRAGFRRPKPDLPNPRCAGETTDEKRRMLQGIATGRRTLKIRRQFPQRNRPL